MLVTQARFAEIVGRSGGRVSQWISEGRLGGEALVMTAEGRMIDSDIARQQLAGTLDVVQQAALARPILADDEAPLERAEIDPDQRRMLKARADEAETRAQRSRLDLMAQSGQWIEAAAVDRTWRRGMADLLNRIEAEFPAVGEAIAAELHGDARSATVALRHAWRALRAKLAAEAAQRRDAPPASAERELEDAAA